MTKTTDAVHVVLAERLAHLDAAAWEAVTREADVFLRAPFLQAVEVAGPGNVSPRYALLYRDEQPIAAVVLQLVHVQGRTAVTPSTALGGMAQIVDERALVLGSLSGWGQTGVALAPGVDADIVWPEVLRLVDGVRRFEKAGGAVNVALLKDVAAQLPERTLRLAGYQRVPSGPDMRLLVDPGWKTLSDTLDSMTSKSRTAVRRTLRQVEDAGYTLRSLSVAEAEQHEVRLDDLYTQVWANADVRPVKLSGRFFVELKRRLGDDCALLGLVRDGELDGFGVCLKNGENSVGYYLGFDRTKEAPLYLRLLVAMVEQGLSWGARVISLGRTAEEPKARMGAVAEPSWLWVKHRTPPFNWAVGAVLSTVQPVVAPSHRVFKEAVSASPS